MAREQLQQSANREWFTSSPSNQEQHQYFQRESKEGARSGLLVDQEEEKQDDQEKLWDVDKTSIDHDHDTLLSAYNEGGGWRGSFSDNAGCSGAFNRFAEASTLHRITSSSTTPFTVSQSFARGLGIDKTATTRQADTPRCQPVAD